MVRRSLIVLVACLPVLAALGCGGGGGSGAPLRQGCSQQGSGSVLCLVRCNLGCTQTGCAISDIYQNQQIVLTFNQNIDPTSVTSSSVSLRTSAAIEISRVREVELMTNTQPRVGEDLFAFELEEFLRCVTFPR